MILNADTVCRRILHYRHNVNFDMRYDNGQYDKACKNHVSNQCLGRLATD